MLWAILAPQMLAAIGWLVYLYHVSGIWQIQLLSLLPLAITWLGGLIVIEGVLQSLRTLQTAVQTMAQGNWQAALTLHSFEEIEELARAFNDMANQLKGSWSEMEYLNQALKQSEQRGREFLHAIPLGIVIYKRPGKMVFANAEARQFLGLEDVPSVSCLSLAETFLMVGTQAGAPYPLQELPIVQSLRGDKGWADDIVLRRGEQEIPIEMASTPIFDQHGQVEYAIATFQDITTRKQMQQMLADYNRTLEEMVAQRTDALRQMQATQAVILAAIPDLLLRYDRDGICLDVMSPGSVHRIPEPEAQIGHPITAVLPTDLAAQRLQHIHLALETGQPQVYEYRIETPTGWRYEEARIVRSGEHEVLAMVRDITERKQAEISLQESQMLYRSLTEVLPHGLYRIDRQGRLTFANPAYLRIVNQSLSDCLGKTAAELFPGPMAQGYAADDEQVMATGQTLTQVETYRNAIHDEPAYFQVCKSPLYNAEGAVIGMQGVLWDVTPLKRTEAELDRQKQFLQNVLDSIPSMIMVKDLEERIQIANRASAAMHGMTPADMLGKLYSEINPHLSPLEVEHHRRLNQQVVATQMPYQAEQEIVDMSGARRWYQFLISPFRDSEGNVNGVVGNCIDITDRKQIEIALQAANEKLERLATLDGLTQIPNRRRFDEYLQQEWQRMVREQQPLSLILFDVDFFKAYNDHFGHQQGDEGLIAIAQAANSAVKRAADLLARYGGEEFGVILPNTRRTGAEIVAKAIQQQIEQLRLPHPKSRVNEYITVSMGIASVVPTTEQTPENLVGAADAALYQAKRRGRNRYWIRLI